jgi:transcriptional regulator with XRE-family HTH domain
MGVSGIIVPMPRNAYPPVVLHAARLLGAQVRAGRMARGWTITELAERAGVAEKTVRKVEHGDPRVALGTAFDCAVLVGVALFYDDPRRMAAEAERGRAPLIGRRVRPSAPPETDLDF